MAETDIGYIGNGIPWYPNPYSIAAAEKSRLNDGMVYLNESRRYGDLNLRMEDMNPYTTPTWNYGVVFKSYIYVPQPPRIKNGRIMAP